MISAKNTIGMPGGMIGPSTAAARISRRQKTLLDSPPFSFWAAEQEKLLPHLPGPNQKPVKNYVDHNTGMGQTTTKFPNEIHGKSSILSVIPDIFISSPTRMKNGIAIREMSDKPVDHTI